MEQRKSVQQEEERIYAKLGSVLDTGWNDTQNVPEPPALPSEVPGYLLVCARVRPSQVAIAAPIEQLSVPSPSAQIVAQSPGKLLHHHVPSPVRAMAPMTARPKLAFPSSFKDEEKTFSQDSSYLKLSKKNTLDINSKNMREQVRLAKWALMFHDDDDDDDSDYEFHDDRARRLLKLLDDSCFSLDQETDWDVTLTLRDESLSMIIPDGFPRHCYANKRHLSLKPHTDYYFDRRSVGFEAHRFKRINLKRSRDHLHLSTSQDKNSSTSDDIATPDETFSNGLVLSDNDIDSDDLILPNNKSPPAKIKKSNHISPNANFKNNKTSTATKSSKNAFSSKSSPSRLPHKSSQDNYLSQLHSSSNKHLPSSSNTLTTTTTTTTATTISTTTVTV